MVNRKQHCNFFSYFLLKLVNAILEGCSLLRNEVNRIHFFKEREAQYISLEFTFEFLICLR